MNVCMNVFTKCKAPAFAPHQQNKQSVCKTLQQLVHAASAAIGLPEPAQDMVCVRDHIQVMIP